MYKSTILFVTLSIILIAVRVEVADIQKATAGGAIYIRADGSIDPPTANITAVNNVTYIFTGNINDSIVIERSNIVVDGAGYIVQFEGSDPQGIGITLTRINNVTVENMEITNFYHGIYLYDSSGNTINGGTITGNYIGIFLESHSNRNVISYNNVSNNIFYGFDVRSTCDDNILNNNTAFNNKVYGMILTSSNTTVTGNTISNNANGIYVGSSGNNTFFHNHFVNNTNQVFIASGTNVWDNGYPSGGNFWDDYLIRYPNATDQYHGENQDLLGGDGIWDNPYIIEVENQDKYPLGEPWTTERMVGDANGDGTVDIFDLSIVGLSYGRFSWMAEYDRYADLNLDGVVDAQDLGIITFHWGETTQ